MDHAVCSGWHPQPQSMASCQRALHRRQFGGKHLCRLLSSHIVSRVNRDDAHTYSPSLVRDLPVIIQSENEVRQGIKSPEEHERLDQYERAQLYNMSNIVGSALVVLTYAVSVGIAHAIGYGDSATLIHSYNILLAYFGAITVICTLPFLIIQKVGVLRTNQAHSRSTVPANNFLLEPRGIRRVLNKFGPPRSTLDDSNIACSTSPPGVVCKNHGVHISPLSGSCKTKSSTIRHSSSTPWHWSLIWVAVQEPS